MKMFPTVMRRSASTVESQGLVMRGEEFGSVVAGPSGGTSSSSTTMQIGLGASSSSGDGNDDINVNGNGNSNCNDDDDPVEKNKGGTMGGLGMGRGGGLSLLTPSPEVSKLLVSTMAWIIFGLCGWYLPRYILHQNMALIAAKPVRVQVVVLDGGDPSRDVVIVDPLLDEPLVDPPTVDSFLLKLTAVYLPLLFLVLHSWFVASRDQYQTNGTKTNNNNGSQQQQQRSPSSRLRQWYNVTTSISAFALAIGLSEGTTVLLKIWVQRRRPNFYALCGFVATTATSSSRVCNADIQHVVEANLSFPSGHSSLVSCGMTFLIWYLHGWQRDRVRDGDYGEGGGITTTGAATTSSSATTYRQGQTGQFRRRPPQQQQQHIITLFLYTCAPLGWMFFVGASRLVDHWHHPSDVVAGWGIGAIAATIAYHHFYPSILHIIGPSIGDGTSSIPRGDGAA